MTAYSDAEIGHAVRVIASLFVGVVAASPPADSAAPTAGKRKPTSETVTPAAAASPEPAASSPAEGSTPTAASTPSTPAPQKAEGGGNNQGLTPADFGKRCMDFARAQGDNGASLKAIWVNYQNAEGKPVSRAGEVQEKDYDAFLAELELA